MHTDTPSDPATQGKLLASWSVKWRIVAASVGVLSVGWLAAPAGRTVEPSRTEERANPLIEEQVAANLPPPPPPPPFTGISTASEAPRAHVVALLPPGPDQGAGVWRDGAAAGARRATAGVVVSDGYVLTHAAALEGRLAVRLMTATRSISDAVVASYDDATRLVLLRTATRVATPAVLASTAPPVGALAVGVTVDGEGPLALPVFVSAVRGDRFLVTGHQATAGLPIFTLSGALIGVTSGGTSNEVVSAAGAVDRMISRAAAGEVPRSLGLALQRIPASLRTTFGDAGVLVSDVVPDGPAAAAGVEPGDVLLAVDGAAIATLPEAEGHLLGAAAAPEVTLRLRRRGRDRQVAVDPASAYLVAHLAARADAADPAGLPIAVLPAPWLDRSGLPLSARLLDVDGRPAISRAQVERALAAAAPVAVLRVRDERGAYFVGVETGR